MSTRVYHQHGGGGDLQHATRPGRGKALLMAGVVTRVARLQGGCNLEDPVGTNTYHGPCRQRRPGMEGQGLRRSPHQGIDEDPKQPRTGDKLTAPQEDTQVLLVLLPEASSTPAKHLVSFQYNSSGLPLLLLHRREPRHFHWHQERHTS